MAVATKPEERIEDAWRPERLIPTTGIGGQEEQGLARRRVRPITQPSVAIQARCRAS
jgi:hypothetical protein